MAAEVLQPILEEAWLGEAILGEWTVGIIVKIPKKGNLKICDYWRGICVLRATSKIISNVILVFVYFEKAFDSVDREGLWIALRRRGIPNQMVSVIKSAYNVVV